ncbi:MAG: PilZ domain-containing protein [Sphingomonadales bacterium]|nr:MAG: PilZ domain-containing protein [Sphingomonadales bacterium]TNF04853.1 MAG: PilZ domain-containing protein [Sphingomonadales bacterium]
MSHHHRHHHRHNHHDRHHDRPERIPVDIEVVMTSVLAPAGEVRLRDLTEEGALIEGASLPQGTQFQIEYRGQTIFGSVIWAEHDRFGARFIFALSEGPLYERLEIARVHHHLRHSDNHAVLAATKSVSRTPAAFGRRVAN